MIVLLSRVERAVPRELATFSLASFLALWNCSMAEMRIGDLTQMPPPASELSYAAAAGGSAGERIPAGARGREAPVRSAR